MKQKKIKPSNRLSHGAHSLTIRQRYSDLRTTEGRQLADIMNGLVDDLGGQGALTSVQTLTLENIRTKLIVLLQIGKYIDRQESIITSDGELLPCLGRGFTAYSEAIRRDLEGLMKFSQGKTKGVPSLSEWIDEQKK